jgi:hypothetical protein
MRREISALFRVDTRYEMHCDASKGKQEKLAWDICFYLDTLLAIRRNGGIWDIMALGFSTNLLRFGGGKYWRW